VELLNEPSKDTLQKFSSDLQRVGFELLDDQKKQQIEKIKTVLLEKIQKADVEEHFGLIKFLTRELHKDYSHLSKLFTEVEGITIEQFFILQKIEKVKEWLVYDELTLSEISYQLGYSSVAHLSAQFKRVTGMTPSEFKKLGNNNRKSIDSI
jgi:AraC-like DNA-binding protein